MNNALCNLRHELDRDGLQPNSDGLQLNSDGLQPNSDGLQLNSDGLQPICDGLQLNSDGLQLNSNEMGLVALLEKAFRKGVHVVVFLSWILRANASFNKDGKSVSWLIPHATGSKRFSGGHR